MTELEFVSEDRETEKESWNLFQQGLSEGEEG